MKRSILQAGAWTAFGLVAAIAVVSASSNRHRAVQTPAPAAKATVASASAEKCVPTDACCAREAKVVPTALVAATPAPKAKAVAQTENSSGVGGIVVALDPESGELGMPSPEQMAEIQAIQHTLPSDELNHSDAGLVQVDAPYGGKGIMLQGRFQEFATVHFGPNGKLILGCADRPTVDKPAPQTAPSALEEK